MANGNWLKRGRVGAVAMISGITGTVMFLYLLLGGSGTLDPFGQPVGTDFSAFWHAGRIANEGNPVGAWDAAKLNDRVHATHAGADFSTAWLYPPVFLLIASPLAALPYLPALLVWQLLSLGLISMTLHLVLQERRALLVCLASPLTPVVLGHGQNAFLTAALLGAGLLALTRGRAEGAGVFGGLVYKPQLGLLLTPLLVFTKSWRAMMAAFVVSVLLIGFSIVLWGHGSWIAFAESLPTSRIYMETGAVGHHKSASLFSMCRQLGAPVSLAYAVQLAGAAAAFTMIWHLRNSGPNLLSAGTCAAVALSTPYLLDYDMAIVGLGAAFLYAESKQTDFIPFERTALAYIWIAPWFSRPAAQLLLLPVSPVATLLLAWLVLRRAALRA